MYNIWYRNKGETLWRDTGFGRYYENSVKSVVSRFREEFPTREYTYALRGLRPGILPKRVKAFWYVFSPAGMQSTVKHKSHFSALTEARRLSEDNPGKEFFVYKVENRVISVQKNTMEETTYV